LYVVRLYIELKLTIETLVLHAINSIVHLHLISLHNFSFFHLILFYEDRHATACVRKQTTKFNRSLILLLSH
jgi:hypothetical protein